MPTLAQAQGISEQTENRLSPRGSENSNLLAPNVQGGGSAGVVTANAQQLVDTLLSGNSISVSNVKLTGSPQAVGIFSNAQATIGVNDGVLLSTGNALTGVENLRTAGDNDINTIIGATNSYDAVSLEFDFVPTTPTLTFKYVFGSREYPQYVGTQFNDTFAFLVNGENVALIPGTSTPVSINNVNNGNASYVGAKNSEYFIDNRDNKLPALSGTAFGGITKILPIHATVKANQPNHIKLVISDLGDPVLNSFVGLQAKSFKASYQVKFDLGGASGTPPPVQDVADGDPASQPPAPTWGSYQFAGWYTQDGKPYDFNKPVTGNITLYAHWKTLSFTIAPTRGPTSGNTHVIVDAEPKVSITFTQVSTGIYHSLAIGSDGYIYAWGRNDSGQLGDGTTTDRNVPIQVQTPSGKKFTKVVAGANSSYAFCEDGTVYAWGWNTSGQLGIGNMSNQLTPIALPVPTGASAYKQIIPGGRHTLAVTADGTAWAWGSNAYGQLGDGTTIQRSTPVRVQLPNGVTHLDKIAVGESHTLAIGDNDQTYAWGSNQFGQLGTPSVTLGSQTNTPTPVQIPNGSLNFKQVYASADWSLAIDNRGKIFTWGFNGDNELGNGNTTNQSTPVAPALPNTTTFDSVSLSGNSVLALGSDHQLYAWGYNAFGQLGNKMHTNQATPIVVTLPGGLTLTNVIASKTHSIGIDTEGKIWAWGDNQYGQLGDGKGGASDSHSDIPAATKTPQLVVTNVQFDHNYGTGLTANSDGTWGIDTPAHVSGPVDVTISWKLGAQQQPNFVIHYGYTYYYLLPQAGSFPTVQLAGIGIFALCSTGLLAVATYRLSTRSRRN
ncbi:hypothetical protein KIM372_12710 [Bombiscardovia nodaiensis]|uniref:RCC1-like domain-containing protein n=1 Tax=Bombiscardovia nodaiensis TaxID=2932181 RepID=A0ABM8B969_9BIFI|nr:hypothetical protein KIM372_12710 [Bombiscardovia nodaiensis]